MPESGPYQLCLPNGISAKGESGNSAGLSVGLSTLTLISFSPGRRCCVTSKENGRNPPSFVPTSAPFTQTRELWNTAPKRSQT